MNDKRTNFWAERALDTEEYTWDRDFSTTFTREDADAGSWWMDEK